MHLWCAEHCTCGALVVRCSSFAVQQSVSSSHQPIPRGRPWFRSSWNPLPRMLSGMVVIRLCLGHPLLVQSERPQRKSAVRTDTAPRSHTEEGPHPHPPPPPENARMCRDLGCAEIHIYTQGRRPEPRSRPWERTVRRSRTPARCGGAGRPADAGGRPGCLGGAF